MNCPSCGSPLPPEAKFCRHCGTLTPANYSNTPPSSPDPTAALYPNNPQSGASLSDDPTLKISPSNTPSQMPSTAYISTLYSPHISSVGPQGQKSPHRFSTALAAPAIALAILLLVGGSGLIYYTTVYQPGMQHALATTTATAQLTGTARALATTQAQINVTATAVVENPYTHSGTLAIFDPLSDNSKRYNWTHDTINCGFKNGAYHAIAPNPRYSSTCLADATDFSDFAFEVHMQIIKGGSGGLVFRIENTEKTYKLYMWFVSQDGSYYLFMLNGSSYKLLAGGVTAAIKQGLNQTNLIAVVAQGNSITLYINLQQIASTSDSSYSHGKIGFLVGAYPDLGRPTEAVFSNAKVWAL